MVPLARWAVVVLLASMVLAGCSSNKASLAGPHAPGGGGEAVEGGGTVRGLVVDEEEIQLEGVEVGVAALARSAFTDATGAFELVGVPPGTHFLEARKIGFVDAGQSVVVPADGVVDANFRLTAVPAEVPHADIESYTGHLEWGVRVVPAVGGRASGDILHKWETKDRPDALENLVVELHWRGTQLLARQMRMRVEVDGADNVVNKSFAILEGANPIIGVVEKEQIQGVLGQKDPLCPAETPCKMQWRIFTGTGNTGNPEADFGVMVDQSFTGYVTHFYRMRAPDDYTAADA